MHSGGRVGSFYFQVGPTYYCGPFTEELSTELFILTYATLLYIIAIIPEGCENVKEYPHLAVIPTDKQTDALLTLCSP